MQKINDNRPRRFRWHTKNGAHPNGQDADWQYGCYFPQTDLAVSDMGYRTTGKPDFPMIEWIDT